VGVQEEVRKQIGKKSRSTLVHLIMHDHGDTGSIQHYQFKKRIAREDLGEDLVLEDLVLCASG
jgi:hypothetical protein